MNETKHHVSLSDGTVLSVTVWEREEDHPQEDTVRDILLIHGWPNAGAVWKPLVSGLLIASPFRIVAPDLRGFGGSDKPETGYTCDQFAEDVLNVADALELEDYTLVGHSMGGKIAQVVAARQPEDLARLALIAPAPLVGAPPTDNTERKAAHGNPEKSRDLLAGWVGHPLRDEDLRILTHQALATGKAAWDQWQDVMRPEDFSNRLDSIRVPTLVIAGVKDPLRSQEELKRDVADRIKDANLVAMRGVGHLVHVEDPVMLATVLVNFIG